MRKLKEVLRLHSLGMSQHQIARSCSIAQSTVHGYLFAAQAANVKWPLPEDWDDTQIGQSLFPRRSVPEAWRKHPEPDWAGIHNELQTHKNLTLQLIWQEKRESEPYSHRASSLVQFYVAPGIIPGLVDTVGDQNPAPVHFGLSACKDQ